MNTLFILLQTTPEATQTAQITEAAPVAAEQTVTTTTTEVPAVPVTTTQTTTGSSPFSQIWFLLLIIVIFWFFMIRPQMKRQKELKNFRDSLKKGDKIVTTGGIYGKVVDIQDYYIIMETEGQVRLKVDKSAVVKDMTDATPAK